MLNFLAYHFGSNQPLTATHQPSAEGVNEKPSPPRKHFSTTSSVALEKDLC
jgi:hypothetical protein